MKAIFCYHDAHHCGNHAAIIIIDHFGKMKMSRKRISAATRKAIEDALVEGGDAQTKVAADHRVSAAFVSGIAKGKTPSPLRRQLQEQIEKREARNLSILEEKRRNPDLSNAAIAKIIAEKFTIEISRETVRKVLKTEKAPAQKTKGGKKKKKRDARIKIRKQIVAALKRLEKSGRSRGSVRKIADDFGRSQSGIYKIAREAGLQITHHQLKSWSRAPVSVSTELRERILEEWRKNSRTLYQKIADATGSQVSDVRSVVSRFQYAHKKATPL